MSNKPNQHLPEILFITSYPPRECGIATYSQDLVKAMNNKFKGSFSLRICALESEHEQHTYSTDVKYKLNTGNAQDYGALANTINQDTMINTVMIQHEFGFFAAVPDHIFLQFLQQINKPVVITFHTVLPRPDTTLRLKVKEIAAACAAITVMTNDAASVLVRDYGVADEEITVIEHGTHLVPHLDKSMLKEKYGIPGRKVLSTFGLISSGKSIETTLEALPEIIKTHPDVLFLMIGKTHPSVVKHEGERYREMLQAKIAELGLEEHVLFLNYYLSLPDLLEYLQMTDIYLFTSKDPNQAVSGTFSYAISCACPIISTPIPHAKEVLRDDTGIIIDFQNSSQLAEAVQKLLNDDDLRWRIKINGLQRMASTAWENVSLAYATLFQKINEVNMNMQYRLPPINLWHLQKMTTEVGMIQFARINRPDIESGYTIDDNARALVAMCMHYERTGNKDDLWYLKTYLQFLADCQQPEGNFLNYVDKNRAFTKQNYETNLEDSNGRSIWALGFLISQKDILPKEMITKAEAVMKKALLRFEKIHSTRAMAFAIKGLYHYHSVDPSPSRILLMWTLADRLVQMYRHESDSEWNWYESYLTYGNSILPEALLCAWKCTGNFIYKNIAQRSFEFLLERTFEAGRIKVVSNQSWALKGEPVAQFGEQPIDVAYTILALRTFYEEFGDEAYLQKMQTAFNWFLGDNHLNQIIYNPCTGGCYDGLEETCVNLNQGAESTVSYLMSRFTVEPYFNRPAAIGHKLKFEYQLQ